MEKPPPTPTTAEQVFKAVLAESGYGANSEERLQEILRRMCRALSDVQGNLLYDFLFQDARGKDRDKVHRHFMKLLEQELENQHDYQHEHQGQQGPPHQSDIRDPTDRGR